VNRKAARTTQPQFMACCVRWIWTHYHGHHSTELLNCRATDWRTRDFFNIFFWKGGPIVRDTSSDKRGLTCSLLSPLTPVPYPVGIMNKKKTPGRYCSEQLHNVTPTLLWPLSLWRSRLISIMQNHKLQNYVRLVTRQKCICNEQFHVLYSRS